MKLLILHASQTGQSKSIAEDLSSRLDAVEHTLVSASDYEIKFDLQDFDTAVVISSSTGQGDPPDSAVKFYRRLRKTALPPNHLAHLKFCLLGLGDTNYQTFCAFPKNLDRILLRLGATHLIDTAFADDAVGLEIVVEPWLEQITDLFTKMSYPENINPVVTQTRGSSINMNLTDHTFASIDELLEFFKKLELTFDMPDMESLRIPSLKSPLTFEFAKNTELIMSDGEFFEKIIAPITKPQINGKVEKCYTVSSKLLTSSAALKCVHELSIKPDIVSGFNEVSQFEAGDTLSLICCNPEEEVSRILESLKITDDADKPIKIVPSSGTSLSPNILSHYAHIPLDTEITIQRILACCLDIRTAVKKPFLLAMANSCVCNDNHKNVLKYLSSIQGQGLYTALIREKSLSVLDLLLTFDSHTLTFDTLLNFLTPQKPRPYSISNLVDMSEKLIKFAITEVAFDKKQGRKYNRHGVATTELLKQPDSSKFFYAKSTNWFRLPESTPQNPDTAPLVLICAGTGIAPFLGFLETLLVQREPSLRPSFVWLIYGLRNPSHDLLYPEELAKYMREGVLNRISLGCSRSENSTELLPPDFGSFVKNNQIKCHCRSYVQDCLNEESDLLIEQWIENKGRLYICGDSLGMAKDVRESLQRLLFSGLDYDPALAKAKLKRLTDSGQYKEDVWV